MKNVIFLVFIVTVISVLEGCGSGTGGSGAGTYGALGASLQDKTFHNSHALIGSRAELATQELVSGFGGLYVGELEIVAYNYRPSAAIQTHASTGGFLGDDWSYWVLLQSGNAPGRNNVLQVGDHIQFDQMISTPIEQPFSEDVGQFRVDFFEVYFSQTGTIYDNAYFGFQDSAPPEVGGSFLYKYPQWSGIPISNSVAPTIPGITRSDQTSFNVIFARSDWFPNPVTIMFQEGTSGGSVPVVSSTSGSISNEQLDLIKKLVADGTSRRYYNNLIIVPYDKIQTVVFNADRLSSSTDEDPADMAQNGQPVLVSSLTANRSYLASAQAQVVFDLSDPLVGTPDNSSVVFKGDANNVPFGISLSFMSQESSH